MNSEFPWQSECYKRRIESKSGAGKSRANSRIVVILVPDELRPVDFFASDFKQLGWPLP